MKKFKLILAIAVVTMMLLQSVAFAAMPSGTVVIGDKAYSLSYVNDSANADAIEAAIAAAGANVFVKGFTGNWTKVDGTAVDVASIPAVTYTDDQGTTTSIPGADGDITAPKLTGATFTSAKVLTVTADEALKGTPSVTVLDHLNASVANITAALSEDKKAIVLTKTASFAADAYTVVVNGLTDNAGNPMLPASTIAATKDASYVATITTATTGVAYNTTTAALVNLAYVDQYGDEMADKGVSTIAATAFYGSVPLAVDASTNKVVSIDTTLVPKGATIALTVTSSVGGTVKATLTKNLTVGDAPAATTLSAIATSADAALNVPGTINLTVLDQYGNEFIPGPSTIRWVTSNSAFVNINGAPYVDDDASISVTYPAVGTATVTAFLKSDLTKQISLSITVVPAALTAISNNGAATTAGKNYETTTVTEVVGNANAVLTPDMLKFKVTSTSTGLTESDISLTAAYGTDANASKIYVKANATKSGSYTFETYVGDYAAASPIKTAALTYVSSVNTTVASYDVAAIGANDVKAGTPVYKAITFKNAHGEVLQVPTESVIITSSPNLAVKKFTAKADGTVNAECAATENVAYLQITATSAGVNDIINLSVNSIYKSIPTTSVAAPVATSMTLGASAITVIPGDTLDVATPSTTDSIVMGTDHLPYTAVALNVLDQYGQPYTFVDGATTGLHLKVDAAVSGSAAANYVTLSSLTDGSQHALNSGATAAYLGFNAPSTAQSQVYTVKLMSDATTVISTQTILVSLDAKGPVALASISSSVSSATLTTGSTKATTITGLDQYGRAFPLTAGNIKMVAAANGEYTAVSAGGVVTFTGVKASTSAYDAVVYYDADSDSTLDSSEKTVTVALTVKEIGDAINSIAIQSGVVESTIGATAVDLTKYKAKIAAAADNTYTFTTKGFDASNNEVVMNAGDVTYLVVSTSLKDGATPTDPKAASFVGNVLALDTSNFTGTITGTVVVRARSNNGKTSDMTLTFDSSAVAAQNGTFVATTAANDLTKAVTAVNVDKSTTKSIYLSAIDQYGQVFDFNEGSIIGAGRDNTNFFTVSTIAADPTATPPVVGSVQIAAGASLGTTTLHIFIDLNNQIDLAVTVVEPAA